LEPLVKKLKIDMASGALAIDAIVGPALGGIIVAYELGRQLGLRALFTERDDTGAMTLRRGFEVRQGERILIAEDVVTTGKSSGESAKIVEALGARVVALAGIVDRRAPGIELPWPFYSACQVQVSDWPADSCALCQRGIEVVKPGSRKLPS
jgi:orotate phosphoribosyltransferase